MHMTKRTLALVLALLCAFSVFSCGAAVPPAYAQAENWAVLPERQTHDADLFFVAPTAYRGDDSHFNMELADADTKAKFLGATMMELGIYSDTCDVYAPYYRQASLSAYELSAEEREQYLALAYEDVRESFKYYMEYYNAGRPMVLAGFSQGADMVLRLLEEFFADEEYQDKLIAAYVIGGAVTADCLRQYPHLKMAACATDLGCIVSFNSEAPEVTSSVIVPTTTVGINPLNWKTDATPAEAELNRGACFTDYDGNIKEELPALCGAYLDATRGTLKITGVTPADYPAGLSIFTDGVYHIYDYQFFYRNLQENVAARAEQYRALSFIEENYAGAAEPPEPEATPAVSQYLITADNVPQKLLDAQYWIDRASDPQEPIMTAEEIGLLDLLAGEDYFLYSEQGSPTATTAEELKAYLSDGSLPEDELYLDGQLITAEYWGRLAALENTAGVAEQNPVRYGICVERTGIRGMPTDDVLSSSARFTFYDEMQNSSILFGEPVVILHESADGSWLFILTRYCSGWMHKEDIAVCSGLQEWRAAQDFKDFLVVTDDKIRLDHDPLDAASSELELTMGVRLELANSAQFNMTMEGRQALDCYAVKLPTRDDSGAYKAQYAFVPMSLGVHEGYLPYTRENVLELAFNCLGTRYGWGGMYNARDCSQYVMELYRCFGLVLPRNTSGQTGIDCPTLTLTGMSRAHKSALLDATPPGSLLLFPGHVMLYLGESEGEYYVISAVGAMNPSYTGAGQVTDCQSVAVNSLSVTRRSGHSWMEDLETVKVLDE